MVRKIEKNLIGREDLLLGKGIINQTRNSESFPITKLDIPFIVTSYEELRGLDVNKIHVAGYVNNSAELSLYTYNANNIAPESLPEIVSSTNSAGTWGIIVLAGGSTTTIFEGLTPEEKASIKGQSIAPLLIYMSSATGVPLTPTGGFYDFASNTLNAPPGWTEDFPVNNNVNIYVSRSTAMTIGANTIDLTLIWSTPIIAYERGEIGGSLSVAEITVYKRVSAKPDRPIGGSFDFSTQLLTAPAGWSVGIPEGTGPVYVSITLAVVNRPTETDTTLDWSDPVIAFRDGASALVVTELQLFRRSAVIPDTPVGGSYALTHAANGEFSTVVTPPDGWTIAVPSGSDPAYVTTTFGSVGTPALGVTASVQLANWSAPVVAFADGSNTGGGEPGASVDIIFRRSPTKPDTPAPSAGTPAGWVTNPDNVTGATGTIWAVFGHKMVGGTLFNWVAPVKVEGSDGSAVDIIFKRSEVQPDTPAPSAGTPPGWVTDFGTLERTLKIWASLGTKKAGAALFTWMTPYIVEGQDGKDGQDAVTSVVLDIEEIKVYTRGELPLITTDEAPFTAVSGHVAPASSRNPTSIAYGNNMLYSLVSFNSRLYRTNLTTKINVNIGQIASAASSGIRDRVSPVHIFFIGDTLYGLTGNAGGAGTKLYTINLLNAEATSVASETAPTTPDPSILRDFAYNDVTNTVYAITADALYTFDITTLARTQVGIASRFELDESNMTGITFVDGILYGIGISTSSLVTINLDTGVALKLATLPSTITRGSNRTTAQDFTSNGDVAYTIVDANLFSLHLANIGIGEDTPIGGTLDSTLTADGATTLVVTPPAGWSNTVPAGTTTAYVATTAALIEPGTAELPNTSTTLTDWYPPKPAFLTGETATTGIAGTTVDLIFIKSKLEPIEPEPSIGVPAGWFTDPDDLEGILPAWVSFGFRTASGDKFTWSRARELDNTSGSKLIVNSMLGRPGASFHTLTLRGGIFPLDAVASADFLLHFGRNPVLDDILIYRNDAGTEVSIKRFTGSVWVDPGLFITGDVIALGTIAGDRFTAGTEITAPLIKGGSVQLIGTAYMKIQSATPFGPDNLIDWYGPRALLPNGNVNFVHVTKARGKFWLDAVGGAYFAGTIEGIATTVPPAKIVHSAQTQTADTSLGLGPFNSNGGNIIITAAFSFSSSALSITTGAGAVPTVTLSLQRETSPGVYMQVQASNLVGSIKESGIGFVSTTKSVAGALSYTDTLQVTTDRTYRVVLVNPVNISPISGSLINTGYFLSIQSEE